jgi:hypothetical protein
MRTRWGQSVSHCLKKTKKQKNNIWCSTVKWLEFAKKKARIFRAILFRNLYFPKETSYFNTYFQLNRNSSSSSSFFHNYFQNKLHISTFPTKLKSYATKNHDSCSYSSLFHNTFQKKLHISTHFQLNVKAMQTSTTILFLLLLSSTIFSKRSSIFQHVSNWT